MTVPSVNAVVARITGIHARFAPQALGGAQAFAAALQHAQQAAGTPPRVAGARGPVPAQGGGAMTFGAAAAAAPPLGAGHGAAAAAPPGDPGHPAAPAGTGAGLAGDAGPWAARLPARGQAWAPALARAAAGAGVDPALLASVVWAESGFDPGAVSHAGARGLAQLMPGTARSLGVDADDPVANLEGGARYLRAQLDRFGSLDLALAAYNAGPGRVAQAGGVPAIAETRAYVPRVLDYYARLQGAP